MSFKAILFLIAAFLIVSSRASYSDEESHEKGIFSKVLAPAASPPLTPPTPSPPAYKPPTPAPPVKPPTPSPPVYKPPTPPTPVIKPPVKPPTAPLPPAVKPPPHLPPVRTRTDCIPLCGERCKLHSRQNVCIRACMACCDKCKCVPPGTYGNREMCGKCYTDMTTRRNKSKCP